MRILLLIAALSAGIAGCSGSHEQKDKENLELVTNYVNAVEKMDFNTMNNYLDEKYVGIGPSYGDTIYKAQAVENWKYNVENLYEKIHYNRSKFVPVTLTEGDNKGEWVVNWAELNITYKNGGKTVTIWANTSYLIENGKIIKTITVYNEADALRQLGYQFIPPADGQ
ncbi:MAG: hypothetical protein BWY70_01863 [Bacteroidetes bacterium ADurb.Bin408]|nr:MAG: hypothetical protein BWY70_01863 [Bacteroidetes bacterium ADurb.Bin408]